MTEEEEFAETLEMIFQAFVSTHFVNHGYMKHHVGIRGNNPFEWMPIVSWICVSATPRRGLRFYQYFQAVCSARYDL